MLPPFCPYFIEMGYFGSAIVVGTPLLVLYKDLSAVALTLLAPEKYREKTGAMKERKTIWAPLLESISPMLRKSGCGLYKSYLVIGSASHKTRRNLKV
ncbi:hypothetical protein EYC80_000455 [Monilinia laxa]|uniref:Uncharacterized protein n=1 Tax=Monilinia laxa TaxID=61186 RepID=A0A5N6KAN4_MONLA|nr:hypothetical protein EYC80_000455 [Monilinia laxa]